MATDSVIEFYYSDNVLAASLYVRANTDHETFIPTLERILAEIQNEERFHEMRLNWGYIIIEIIAKLRKEIGQSGILCIGTSSRSIYLHKITVDANLYKDNNIHLSKVVQIESTYGRKTPLFSGSILDFVKFLETYEQDKDEEFLK